MDPEELCFRKYFHSIWQEISGYHFSGNRNIYSGEVKVGAVQYFVSDQGDVNAV